MQRKRSVALHYIKGQQVKVLKLWPEPMRLCLHAKGDPCCLNSSSFRLKANACNTPSPQKAGATKLTKLPCLQRCFHATLVFPWCWISNTTLLATDSLHESLLVVLERHTGRTCEIPFWLLAGRATFKNRLAEEDVKSLPANEHVIGFAEREARRGRRIVLATAANLAIAQKIQRRFPFISEVLASADGLNLKGSAKADQLARQYPDGFLYAGDSRADLQVWKKATGAIFVGRSAALAERISRQVDLQAVLLTKTAPFQTLGKGLRIHRWAKNALVFVPLILGGKQEGPIAWLQALGAFVALSLLASATYLLNDLWDLPEDRQHWSKRNRPLASGQLSIAAGVTDVGGRATGLGARIHPGTGVRGDACPVSSSKPFLLLQFEARADRRCVCA
jgi:hypothetical protein